MPDILQEGALPNVSLGDEHLLVPRQCYEHCNHCQYDKKSYGEAYSVAEAEPTLEANFAGFPLSSEE